MDPTEIIEELVAGNLTGEADYLYWSGRAAELLEEHSRATAKKKLAAEMEEEIRQAAPDPMREPYLSFVQGALDEVDWEEVAETPIDIAEEELEE